MSFFKHHIFFCTNQRANGEACCNDRGASELWAYAKEKAKAAGLGDVRVNKAGCLGRCEHGPVAVVYPDETWYTFIDKEDIDEIVDSHLKQGKVVERLKI
ncbi:MAG: (2Fe-2S) ferredoxin domain-containing protein [Rhodocyclaceae bacterium]|nr:MAG: (2Fe-2S) ferredoxin domain-containing protein [Rhodocyclaceae bacterium]